MARPGRSGPRQNPAGGIITMMRRRHQSGARFALLVALGALLMLTLWLAFLLWWPDPGLRPLTWQELAPPTSVNQRSWRWIVIHHSASASGSTAAIDRWHRQGNGWDGIGYHFTIGNGHGMVLGQVDATFRWAQQREGAHAGGGDKGRPYNQLGIGICLIGDFNKGPLPDVERARLVELCALLITHVPSLGPESIIGHRDVPGKETACPGTQLDIDAIRYEVRKRMAKLAITP
jgi:hypothetical protein